MIQLLKQWLTQKDILFQQFDGRTLLDINDGGFVGIANQFQVLVRLDFEDTDNGSNYLC